MVPVGYDDDDPKIVFPSVVGTPLLQGSADPRNF